LTGGYNWPAVVSLRPFGAPPFRQGRQEKASPCVGELSPKVTDEGSRSALQQVRRRSPHPPPCGGPPSPSRGRHNQTPVMPSACHPLYQRGLRERHPASKAPLGKELSALCRLRFGAPYLREMYDPSILADTETIKNGGIWRFSAITPSKHPSGSACHPLSKEGWERPRASTARPYKWPPCLYLWERWQR